jgi:hypothetical protein
MGLSSRWDRFAGFFILLLVISAMAGCQALHTSNTAAQSGTFSAASTTLDFGTAVVGTTTEVSDTLTNGSADTVTVASTSSSNASFQWMTPAMPFTLSPGQSATLTIAFSPKATGKPAGKISVNTSRGGKIDIAVSGSAVAQGVLAASPGSLSFGNVGVGQSQAKAVTLSNSGGTSVTVSQASVSSGAFSISGLTLPVTIDAGQSAAFNVVFAPKSAGVIHGSVTLNGVSSLTMKIKKHAAGAQDTAPASVAFTVSGDGIAPGQLVAAPSSVSFGNVTTGSAQSQTVTLTNSGGTSASITQANVSGAGLNISGLTLPLSLGAGQSISFQLTFSPTSAGTVSGGLTITSTANNANLSMAVTGTAVAPPALALNRSSVSFGNVTVGTTQNQPVTITNSGGSSVTITRATAAGTGYSISGLVTPLALSPGQSSGFTVAFAPQAAGSSSGSVALVSDIATVNLTLTGTGQAVGTLGANPASVAFGSVQVGNNQAQTITLTNTGSSSVTISQVSASGNGFSLSGISPPLSLGAGTSTTFTATFNPNAERAVTGRVAITSTASNPSLNVELSGTGVSAATLAASPPSIGFGSVQVGSTQSQSERLTNSGGSVLHIATATVTGAGFGTTGLSVPTTLNPGQSLTLNVTFTPSGGGAANGNLTLAADGSVPTLSVALSGTGATPGQLAVSPATANFGSVMVGANQKQSGSLTASGASVTISAVSSSNPEFTLTGLSLPVTLAAGQSVPFAWTFAPQASGVASATITFAGNASNPPVTAALTGTGTAAPQHTVSLSWTASTSTVVGYNVYRGRQSGGPYAVLNSAADASTTYTDSTVQAGQTYYYVVTAVDSSGNESVNSNQAQAVVPTP